MNKLLARMLVMAMVLGMATTAFAAEDDAATADGGETPVEETNEDATADETTPAEGEETAPVEETPAEETPVEAGYTDVTEANWFYEAVTYVTENGLVDGETETTFAPSADMTRADMIVALYRMAGSPEVTGENPFTDVAADADYYAAVIWGTSNGVINGTSETTFGPLLASTRSQVVAILYRLEGSPAVSGSNPFVDATADWVRDAVLWASQNGIVEGYSDTAFGPDDTITREQLAAILYRYASYKSYGLAVTGDLSIFDDASDVAAWSHTPLAWAVGKGLVQGSNNLVDPQGSAIRAQLAVILMRFLENVAV